MGLWVREPELWADEEAVWTTLANREQSGLRQVGGKLFATRQRLLFEPNHFDRLTGGRSWSVTLATVSAVDTENRSNAAPVLGKTAKLRRRLRIELRDGSVELFVVNGVDNAVEKLRGVRSSSS